MGKLVGIPDCIWMKMTDKQKEEYYKQQKKKYYCWHYCGNYTYCVICTFTFLGFK